MHTLMWLIQVDGFFHAGLPVVRVERPLFTTVLRKFEIIIPDAQLKAAGWCDRDKNGKMATPIPVDLNYILIRTNHCIFGAQPVLLSKPQIEFRSAESPHKIELSGPIQEHGLDPKSEDKDALSDIKKEGDYFLFLNVYCSGLYVPPNSINSSLISEYHNCELTVVQSTCQDSLPWELY